jgi:hypothetical protein
MSLARRHPPRMIDLGSIEGLHAHDHQLAAYCPCCDVWRVLPLAELIEQGKGSLRLPLAVRCRDCGAVGQLQVRPPAPAWTNTNGWPAPSRGQGVRPIS